MAQFGIEATQLSAPQGAGSSPVSAVPSALPGITQGLGNVVNIFARGILDNRKQEAEEARKAVLAAYSKKLEGINQGLRTGQLSPREARMQQRAISSETRAAYSDMIPDLEKVTKSFMGVTELADADAELEDARSQRNQLIKSAQAAGFEIDSNDTTASTDAKISAYQATVRADASLKAFYQEAEYLRAQGRYDQEVQDRKQKDVAFRALADVANSQYEVTYQEVNALSQAVSSGRIQAPEAQAIWASRMARVHTALVKAAEMNPELANVHRGLFEKIEKMGMDLLDPGKKSQAVKDQLDMLLNQAKLAIVQDPKVARVVGASQLFGNNAQLMLQASGEVAKIISSAISGGPSTVTIPPVIGTAESKDVFRIAREAVQKANTGSYENKKAANTELANLSSHLLQQFGEAVNKRGFDIKQLNDAVDFFSSPEFGKFASENRLDTEAITAAIKTFESVYKPTVTQAVTNALERVITTDTGLKTARAGRSPEDINLEKTSQALGYENVVPVFNATGINFRIKNPSTNPVVRAAEARALSQLNNVEKAINKVIHIGAHLEGTTDYNRFWEANKHELMPMYFSAPTEAPRASKPGNTGVKRNKAEDAMSAEVFSLNEGVTPGTPENVARRREQDIIAIKKELSRRDVGPEARKILEAELAKLER